MKKTILTIICAALLVGSCSKFDNPNIVEDGVMRIEASHPSVTKATTSGFEDGDKIGIYVTEYSSAEQDAVASPLQISGNWANNVAATLSNSSWETSKNLFWSDKKLDIYGYYPHMRPGPITKHPFAVSLDQSGEGSDGNMGGYEASDFLWGKTEGAVQGEGPVSVALKHSCSKLVVKLVKGSNYTGEFPSLAELYIHNVVPTATIDFTTGAVVKDIFGEPATIKARKVDNETYEAIIVPQRITTRLPFLEFISYGISYLAEGTFLFKAGVEHTIKFTIDSNPNQIRVEIGGEVVGGEF